MSDSRSPADSSGLDSNRRLAAVWFADLVGYSRLAAEDERTAMRLLHLFQNTAEEEIGRASGKLIKRIGDAVLAEFSSTEAAVRAALALQVAFASASATNSIEGALRIGVHVGDVVVSPDGDLYGDGVNVASRIQDLAEPGQVLVSEDIWKQLRARTDYRFTRLGERALKNMPASITVYAVTAQREEGAAGALDTSTTRRFSIQRRAPTWLRRAAAPVSFACLAGAIGFGVYIRGDGSLPSFGVSAASAKTPHTIAVLPFDNLSSDPENEYFSDGITEDILGHLAKIQDLRVISRTSVMQYKNADTPLRQIGEELGAGVILEGSVRKDRDRVRIVAQLIDARTDRHLWSDTYDRELADVFAVQSEIARTIARELRTELTLDEARRIESVPSSSVKAYELYLQGQAYQLALRRENSERAIRFFRRALEVDPSFALAYTGIADSYASIWFSEPVPRWLDSAYAAARRAIAIDSTLSEAHSSLGRIYEYTKQEDAAIAAQRLAIRFKPSNAVAYARLARALNNANQPAEALRMGSMAVQLNPNAAVGYRTVSFAYLSLGEIDRAEEWMLKSIEVSPTGPTAAELGTLGEIAVLRGDATRIRAVIQSLLDKTGGEDSERYEWAAALATHVGDYQQAAAHLDRARSLSANIEPKIIEARLLRELGNTSESERILQRLDRRFRRVLSARPRDPDLAVRLAYIAAQRGREQEALDWLRQAAKFGSTDYRMVQMVCRQYRANPEFQRIISTMRANAHRALRELEADGTLPTLMRGKA